MGNELQTYAVVCLIWRKNITRRWYGCRWRRQQQATQISVVDDNGRKWAINYEKHLVCAVSLLDDWVLARWKLFVFLYSHQHYSKRSSPPEAFYYVYGKSWTFPIVYSDTFIGRISLRLLANVSYVSDWYFLLALFKNDYPHKTAKNKPLKLYGLIAVVLL